MNVFTAEFALQGFKLHFHEVTVCHNSVFIMCAALYIIFICISQGYFVCVCILAVEFNRLTRVMVYPVGEDSLRRRLPICLGGRHTSETIYTNGGGNAGHCGGTDAWRSAATCSHSTDRQRETLSIQLCFYYFDWPPSNSWKCQRGWSNGPVRTLNVRLDIFS